MPSQAAPDSIVAKHGLDHSAFPEQAPGTLDCPFSYAVGNTRAFQEADPERALGTSFRRNVVPERRPGPIVPIVFAAVFLSS